MTSDSSADPSADSSPAHARDVSGCLATAVAALGACADTSARVLGDAEVQTAAVSAQRLAAAAAELTMRLMVEVDSRGLATDAGVVSAPAWLRSMTRLTSAAAADRTRLGARLSRREATRAALARGSLMVEQASAITHALDTLPETVEPEQVTQAEQYLLEQAAVFDARDLAMLGRRVLEVIDIDAADAHEAARLEAEEHAAQSAARFSIRSRGDGTSRGSFILPTAQASLLRAALEALCNPRRHTTGDHDPRGQAEEQPDCSGDPGASAGTDSGFGHAGAEAPVAGSGASHHDPGADEDRVPYPQRMGHALAALVEHLSVDALPQAGGVNATVVVNLDLDQLVSALGSASLSTGEVISASQARRLACSAGIIPAVFGGASLPLDLGRGRRLHSAAQRTALAVVQGGCVFGDCDRSPAWCETHHTVSWSEGGTTDLGTGALLCPRHHHLVHGQGWHVIVDDGGIPHTVPPPCVDPTRRRRTHPRFRQSPARHGPLRRRGI